MYFAPMIVLYCTGSIRSNLFHRDTSSAWREVHTFATKINTCMEMTTWMTALLRMNSTARDRQPAMASDSLILPSIA